MKNTIEVNSEKCIFCGRSAEEANILIAGAKGVIVTKNLFSGTRTEIKRQTTDKALTMLLKYIR